MAKTQLGVRIAAPIKKTIETYCRNRGLRMNHFVEQALLERLEELLDLEDLKKIMKEPTRPLADVMKEHGLTRKR
jgi:hypothetical protein